MSVIETLVTDRTAADVEEWLRLRALGLSGMSEVELARWLSGMKGAFNAADMNRIGEACNYIAGTLNAYGKLPAAYETQKTDWAIGDRPTRRQRESMIKAVALLKAATNTPGDIPESSDGMTYADANNLEIALLRTAERADSTDNGMVFAGEGFSGEAEAVYTVYKRTDEPVSIPTVSRNPKYTGELVSPVWNGYFPTLMTESGETSAVDVGTYTAIFTLKDPERVWTDQTSAPKEIEWRVINASVAVPVVAENPVYDGTAQGPAWGGYDPMVMTLGGQYEETDVGHYTAVFTLNDEASYTWEDGTTGPQSVAWSMEKAKISVPAFAGELTYTGAEQTAEFDGYDSGKMSASGTTGTNAGNYTALFTPDGNHTWADGTSAAAEVPWSIGKAPLTKPVQTGTYTYSGEEQELSFVGFDADTMVKGGDYAATDAGEYTATVGLADADNYQWADGGAAVYVWVIEKRPLTVPRQSGTLTYTGEAQEPEWTAYDAALMTVSAEPQINAGDYEADFALTDENNYRWSSGAGEAAWSIGKAAANLTAEPASLTVSIGNTSEITVSRGGDGVIGAVVTGNASLVSVEGNVVTVRGDADGEAQVELTVAESANHFADRITVPINVTEGAHDLPEGYTELAYVTVPDNAAGYLNTGYSGNMAYYIYTLTARLKQATYSGANYPRLFGNNPGSYSTGYGWVELRTSPTFYVTYQSGNYVRNATYQTGDTAYAGKKQKYILDNGNKTFTSGSKSVSTPNATNMRSTAMVLFFNNGQVPTNVKSPAGDYYSFVVSNASSGAENVHFVPAKRDSDGKIGFYDIVRNGFYAPTGFTLEAGPEIM